MALHRPRPIGPVDRIDLRAEDRPFLDQEVLEQARSHKVCMTCHRFQHQAGVNCISLLSCQLHQGLIAHGEHLTSCCQGWTDDMARQAGRPPDVA